MPAVAAIPSLALMAGCALGLLFPRLHPAASAILLAVSIAAACTSWRGARPLLFSLAIASGFSAGGVLLAQRAWSDAWRPPLRVMYEQLAHASRAEAIAARRFVPEDVSVAIEIDGTLRADASPAETGVSLSVDVADAEGRPTPGGILLTVIGDRARAMAGDWRAGRRIHTTAVLRRPARYLDPGVPDEERVLARRGTTLVGTVKSAALVDLVARGNAASEAAASVRAFVRRTIAESVGRWEATSGPAAAMSSAGEPRAPQKPSGQAAAIVTAIVIGDRAGLDEDVQRHLQEAGTYHVIAISGGNIAILAGLTLVAFRIAGILGRAAMLSAIVGLLAYGYLVGGGASVDRATLMAVIYFTGRAIDQRSPPFNTLALAGGVLAAVDPLTVADPAFLLTYGASAGILAIAQTAIRGRERFSKTATRARPVATVLESAFALFAASAASECALVPVSAFVFSRITFAGIALNFGAIPLMAVAQVAGMLIAPVALISTQAAAVVGWVAFAGAKGLVWCADLVRFAPVVTWRVAAPAPWVMATYYGAAMGAWALSRFEHRHRARICRPLIACAAASAIWILFEPWSSVANRGDGRLHVTFIDVGQGDSAFIRFPRGGTLLVDTGGLPGSGTFDIGDRVVAPVLRESGIRRLQTLVLTHGDNDHIGGAPSLMREFMPRDIWEGIPVPSSAPLQARRVVAREISARWTNVQAGDETVIDDVRMIVRNPPLPDWERRRVRNDDSIVLELLWNDVSIVLTGDAGSDAEQIEVPQFEAVPLRILKVPHHGSASASSESFLRRLDPQVAVVSVGRSNSFGHPASAVLTRYFDAGADVYRTDQDGAVMLDTDGHTAHVRTFSGREQTYIGKSHHDDTKNTKDTKTTNLSDAPEGAHAH